MQFNEEKTTQAAAYLLRQSNGLMNYMKLIKLLYMADRKTLIDWGRPITRSKYVSMPLGPVLSEVLDLINGNFPKRFEGYWPRFIQTSGKNVSLVSHPGDGKLSEAEEEILQAVYLEYKDVDRFDIVDELHRTLPEWNYKQGFPQHEITYTAILQAGNRSKEDIESINDELETLNLLDQLLATQ